MGMLQQLVTWIREHQKPLLLWGGGTLVALLLFSVLALPSIIKSQAEKAILKTIGRVAKLEKVSFNPFGMTLTVQKFRLLEPDRQASFVQFGQLRVSLASSSIFRFAPVVDELSLDQLQVQLVRTAENRYNFSDILERLAAQPKKEGGKPPRFSINNIVLQNSSIDFDDQAVKGGKKHTIRELQLAIPFISNIPYLAEKYTDPRFSAVVNGAKLAFNGKTKPMHKTMETDLHLKLHELNLPHYLPYLPAQVPVKLTSGTLTIDLQLAYRIHQNKQPELLIKGLTRLDRIAVQEKNNTPLASFTSLGLQAKEIELFSRAVALQQITLDGLLVHAQRDSNGKLNFQRLATPAQTAANRPAPTAQSGQKKSKDVPPLKLTVDTLAVTNGSVQFVDQQPKGGFKAALQAITLKLSNLSNARDAACRYEFSMQGDQGEQFTAQGAAVLAPLSADSQFNLIGLKLQRGWPYLQELLTAPVKGNLSLEGTAAFKPEDGVAITDLGLHLKDLAAEYGSKDSTRVSSLDITGIDFSQKQNTALVDEIRLGKSSVQVSRESDGRLSVFSLLKTSEKQTPTAPAGAVPAAVVTPKPVPAKGMAEQKPLSWKVARIMVNGLAATFIDKKFAEPPVFRLNNIRLTTGNLTGPKLGPMPLGFSATYGSNAPLKANGTLYPQPVRYAGTVSFARLPITDFESYIPDTVRLYVLDGTLDSAMKLDVGLDAAGKPKGSFSGTAGLRSLHLVDAVQEEDLLKWESLQLDQINGTLQPISLGIRQIALNNVYARVAVRKDKTLNLQNLVAKEQGQGAGVKGQENKGKEQRPESQGQGSRVKGQETVQQGQAVAAKPSIRIDAVTVQDGTMDFSDAHLPRQFRTTFHNLGGRVSGLSSEMNSRAEVDLRGNLENHSPLQITGAVNPLRDDLFVDLTISFKDIELSPATPYSGTYLGYEIDKGKLFLDLKYHIENKQLKAENKIFVDQFTFGNTVESDKATKLPVRLGVALLKDRNGQINLDLPVAGRTDDPKFSIWGVVWQVVTNLFVKAVTSPFALLSSMFGSSEDLSNVVFAPGSATLVPAEHKKLDTLSKALTERPGLKVELSGYVDQKRDPEGYRLELLQQKMRQEKYLELAKNKQLKEGEDAEKITIQPAEYSRYLKAVYKKEKFPKPRNLIGMVKDIPDDEMKKLIIANTLVGDKELQQLATRRAAAVREYLITKGKLESQRLFQKQDAITKPPKESNSPASRVELNPIAS